MSFNREKQINVDEEIEFAKKVFEKLMEVKKKKTKDYGGLRYNNFGLMSLFFDISRKYFRLKTLIFHKRAFTVQDIKTEVNETVEDTIKDLINYCFMFLHEMEIERQEAENENSTDRDSS